ncbi:MAG: energy-coupling factor ABC transporter permease [Clostridia bacterium]|nr:energy-coupling factor ABC transporter permease [Clostridia bacterium]
MSHLHIPDGVIPTVWLLIGLGLVAGLLILSIYKLRPEDLRKQVPKLGIISAFILVVMSIPLGPLPFHLNLTVFAGIILGPWLGFIAVFIVNLILGLMGHGGLTVIGLNTLAVGSEVFIGCLLFNWLKKSLGPVKGAGVTTAVTLVLSSLIMLGIVGGVTANPLEFIEVEEYPAWLSGAAALAQGGSGAAISLSKLASIIMAVTLLGTLLETMAVLGLVRFLTKVRPDILGEEIQEEKCLQGKVEEV